MAAEQHSSADKWILAMVRAAGRFGLPCDIPALRQQMRWFENLPLQRRLERIGALLGLQITYSTEKQRELAQRSDAGDGAARRRFGADLGKPRR